MNQRILVIPGFFYANSPSSRRFIIGLQFERIEVLWK